MRILFILLIAFLSFIFTPCAIGAQEQVQQKAGQPLYFPKGEVQEHPSDLAPESDPEWAKEKARLQREGRSVDELYDEPKETIYEETVRYERIDESSKKHSQPQRWE